MRKIRVMIVDDSTVVRRLLSESLSGDPGLEIAATAPNGRIALAKIPQVNPDLITLDMEMPEMDGLATLRALRQSYPRLPVIMFSTLTRRGAVSTFEALSLGASDYVTKPANVGSVMAATQSIREQLIPKIKALCPWFAPQADLPPTPRKPLRGATAHTPSRDRNRVDVVAIGVSTGGPNALAELFTQLPADLPVPMVIVQHMPPLFTKQLAERLDQKSPLHVREASPGEPLAPGSVWIAPGQYHLQLERKGHEVLVQTNQLPPENSCRPAVDVLFRSVAGVFGPHALAVVMTGMGQDGLRGCQAVHDAGGTIFIQDEATSVVWGMPGAVARAELDDAVFPLHKLANEIVREVWRHRTSPALATFQTVPTPRTLHER
jgi:two-component system, chemotaxis family, protein-glutamate methylesterase/glutaminase